MLLGLESVRIAPGITAVTPFDFTSYPYSHGLVAVLGWSVIFALAHLALRRDTRTSLVLGACVASHWVLDWITHRPDLPLGFGASRRVGLELWASRPATLAVELLMFAVGCALYAGATRANDRTGKLAFAGLIVFLLVAYFAALFGPPPPNTESLGWGGQSVWLLVAWGYWVDRHRVVVERA